MTKGPPPLPLLQDNPRALPNLRCTSTWLVAKRTSAVATFGKKVLTIAAQSPLQHRHPQEHPSLPEPSRSGPPVAAGRQAQPYPPRSHLLPHIGGNNARALSRHRPETAALVVEVDPLARPVVAVLKVLQLLTRTWMERGRPCGQTSTNSGGVCGARAGPEPPPHPLPARVAASGSWGLWGEGLAGGCRCTPPGPPPSSSPASR